MTESLDYIGSELEVFSCAKNWKSYWSNVIDQYVGNSVLDVGAGIGSTAQTMQIRHFPRWVELEPDTALAKTIRDAQLAGKIPKHYEIINGRSQDLVGEQFDTTLYIDVLEHIENDKEELASVSRLLVPGGYVVVVAPAHQYLYTAFDRQIGHFRRYDKQTLVGITPDGFDVVKVVYLDSVGMLASLGNRLLLKSGSPTLVQVKLWDRLMVPISRLIDGLLAHRLGRSIVYIIQKRR